MLKIQRRQYLKSECVFPLKLSTVFPLIPLPASPYHHHHFTISSTQTALLAEQIFHFQEKRRLQIRKVPPWSMFECTK